MNSLARSPARGASLRELLPVCLLACLAVIPARASAADAVWTAHRDCSDLHATVVDPRHWISEIGRPLAQQPGAAGTVDLSGDDKPRASGEQGTRAPASAADGLVANRPWYQNLRLSGFAALEYIDGGKSSTRPFGGFSIRESTLFVEAAAWEDVSMFLEVQVNRLGKDKELFVRTGEVHAHVRNLLKKWGDDLLSVKVGRVDIPFGEDYLWQDAIDNPLISFAAAYPYGFDEGVVAYGKIRGLGWIAAVTDGTDDRSVEENGSKAVNLKLFGRPHDAVYVSGSAMSTGRTSESALEFGGSHIEPVGVGGPSIAGRSPSREVSATLYQADATIGQSSRGSLGVSFGVAAIEDDTRAYDRDLKWFSIEPRYRLGGTVYAIARYSEIGTYDDTRGFHFDGKTTAGGNAAYGYDARRLQRLSVGVGVRPNPRLLLKAEIGRDRFETITSSPLDPADDDRLLVGLALVVGF